VFLSGNAFSTWYHKLIAIRLIDSPLGLRDAFCSRYDILKTDGCLFYIIIYWCHCLLPPTLILGYLSKAVSVDIIATVMIVLESQAHNLKVVGSNPTPATKIIVIKIN
jgi:hypothetical protein